MNLDWLAKIAPTVASAMGGPLAGMAVEFVTKKLGIEGGTVESITQTLEEGKLTAEQIMQLKQAEVELKAKEKELGVKFAELTVKDRADARAMQISTRSLIPGLLAMVVTSGFFGILWMLMSGEAVKSDALMLMLGSLGTAWTSIIAFFFGSSVSSQGKDEMIYKSTPTK